MAIGAGKEGMTKGGTEKKTEKSERAVKGGTNTRKTLFTNRRISHIIRIVHLFAF